MRAVALLRGVNVGRARRLAMADLRRVATALGWRDVSTVLASGNLLFTSARGTSAQLASALEHALLSELGLTTRVVVLSAEQVATVIEEQPFGATADNPSRLLVAAYIDPAARLALAPLTKQRWAPGALSLGRHAAYLWCPEGVLASPLAQAVARVAKDGLTARNWATWQKL